MLRKSLRIIGLALVGGIGILWLFGERWRPLRRSTWEFMRTLGLRRLLDLSALHAYVYGRWTNQYIYVLLNKLPSGGSNTGVHWFANHYHGKVLTHEQAEAIVNLDHDISRQDLEQVIPYPVARDLVLKGPPDVAAYECACRHARADHCEPTQVCMVVGQPFVDFVLEHNPKTSRKLTQMEALDLLKAEHERGHMHSAWFKDVMDNRFYAICNCCKCCCGGIESMVKHGAPMLASSGYVAQVDQELCSNCGVCVDACPFSALSLDDGAVVRKWESCMGCGVCVAKCTSGAVSLIRDEAKGPPLDVRFLA